MNKNFLLIMGITVAAMIGLFLIFGGKESSKTTFEGDPFTIAENENEIGPVDAKVTIIEYGDFECPACLQSFPFVSQFKEEYKDRVRFVFRHFPLSQLNPQLHPNAFIAHRAAQAAANQGKFWEMHDQLYQSQNQWARTSSNLDVAAAGKLFETFAEQLELNMDQYRTDVSSEATNDFIKLQLASGSELDVTGTPSFFINGEKIDSPQNEESYAAFTAKVDELLKANEQTAEPEATPGQ